MCVLVPRPSEAVDEVMRGSAEPCSTLEWGAREFYAPSQIAHAQISTLRRLAQADADADSIGDR